MTDLVALRTALEELGDLSPDGFLAADSCGVITVANRVAEELFGYPPGGLHGRLVEDLMPASFRSLHRRQRDEFVAEGTDARRMGAGRELHGMRADGTTVPVDITLRVVRHGTETVVCAAVRDATQQVQAHRRQEELERQLDRMRRLDSLGQLTGGIAHDFNNLLTVIIGRAEAALDTISAEAPAHADLVEIRDASHRGAELTNKLLTIGRHDEPPAEPLDLNDAVAGILGLLRRVLGEEPTLSTDLADEPLPVFAAAARVEQLLLNLVMNARDAVDSGGSITVRTGTDVLVPDDRRGDRVEAVRLDVIDDGHGMTPDVAEQAFEPFFTTKGSEGTGVGLATVYGIVRRADGDVRINSTPGHGTSVSVLLPRGESEATVRPVSAPRSVQRNRGGTVLLVEDSAAVREVCEEVLVGAGYEVLAASDAEEALTMAAEVGQRVDVALTDLVMPGLSVGELIAGLGELDVEAQVVVMSGYGRDMLDLHGVNSSQVRLLPKPFTTQELLAILAEALESS